MTRKTSSRPTSAHAQAVFPMVLDSQTAQRVTQWVMRWHGEEYDSDEIAEMLEGWPGYVRLAEMMEPFSVISESESAAELARLALRLVTLVERGHLHTLQAKGAFRLACRQLCTRGIPFEETAKGDETALWFHFIAANEFGDTDNTGYSTDFGELRLLARQLLDPDALVEEMLAGAFPRIYDEAYVNAAGALGDPRLVPLLVTVLHRCETPRSLATVINALGRLGDRRVIGLIEEYAYSPNAELASATARALEALGGRRAAHILRQMRGVVPDAQAHLAAHLTFGIMHLEEGPEALQRELLRVCGDAGAPRHVRLCAIERLNGLLEPEVIRTMGELLDDPTFERIEVDGHPTDEVIYAIREAAYVSLMGYRISHLVAVLGEGILERLESFQIHTLPSWWNASSGRGGLPLQDIADLL